MLQLLLAGEERMQMGRSKYIQIYSGKKYLSHFAWQSRMLLCDKVIEERKENQPNTLNFLFNQAQEYLHEATKQLLIRLFQR